MNDDRLRMLLLHNIIESRLTIPESFFDFKQACSGKKSPVYTLPVTVLSQTPISFFFFL